MDISTIINQFSHCNLKTIHEFSNDYIINKLKDVKDKKQKYINKTLREQFPNIEEEVLFSIYEQSISIHQSHIQKNGASLETEITNFLNESLISHRTQVTIDKEGYIVGFGTRKNKCHHIVDFVVGEDIEIGKTIDNFVVLSCKTTCRERWTQDNWSLETPPKKYLLLTTSTDYPLSTRFKENINRKIITCSPKKKDDRIYKLDYDSLLSEIMNALSN